MARVSADSIGCDGQNKKQKYELELNQKEAVDSMACIQEALVNILERKGIINKAEILLEAQKIKSGKRQTPARRASDKLEPLLSLIKK